MRRIVTTALVRAVVSSSSVDRTYVDKARHDITWHDGDERPARGQGSEEQTTRQVTDEEDSERLTVTGWPGLTGRVD
jgi:hypothetical protein